LWLNCGCSRLAAGLFYRHHGPRDLRERTVQGSEPIDAGGKVGLGDDRVTAVDAFRLVARQLHCD